MSKTDILYGFHVAAVGIGIIALWVLFGELGGNARASSHITSFYDPMQNVPSWSAYQRSSYGAYAGIREGEAN